MTMMKKTTTTPAARSCRRRMACASVPAEGRPPGRRGGRGGGRPAGRAPARPPLGRRARGVRGASSSSSKNDRARSLREGGRSMTSPSAGRFPCTWPCSGQDAAPARRRRRGMNRSDAAAARPPAPARPAGDVLGRYPLQRRLGSGGFGTVWLGRDERLERAVAVKVVPRDRVAGGRGWREALAAARLAHPAIVALYEAGADDEAAYLVSELVRGQTLDVLLDEGALSDRDVAAVGMALADALTHAHAQGVIHRDVKPANVIVPDEREEGDPPAKLTDFGVAHVAGGDPLTRTGDVVGTLAYMAPEQAEGRRVTPAADLWALALVIHEGLAGTNPVRADSPAATARRLAEPLPSLGRRRRDLPPALCAAVDKALDPDPARRGTVRELRRALAGARPALGEEPGVIAAGRLERLTAAPGRPRPRLPERALGALATAGLAA